MTARRVENVQTERAADEILVLKEESLEAHALNQSPLLSTICATARPQSLTWPPRFIVARASPPMRRSWTWLLPSWSRPGSWCSMIRIPDPLRLGAR
jgi:hypothetical protein